MLMLAILFMAGAAVSFRTAYKRRKEASTYTSDIPREALGRAKAEQAKLQSEEFALILLGGTLLFLSIASLLCAIFYRP